MKKTLITIVFFVFYGYVSFSQKLPNIQSGSLLAPKSVKIDGKPIEWDSQFKAYNHSTDLYYTIANDNESIYLVIQATDPDNINKIYNGGLTFSIDKTGKRSQKDNISITYPVYDPKDKFHVAISHKPVIDQSKPQTITKADSFMRAANLLLAAKAKYIRTSGITGVDTLISVYNENGIKTASAFNNQMIYTLEISINLKDLDLSITNNANFSYHISLKGLRGYQNMDNVDVTYSTGPKGRQIPTVHLPDNFDFNHMRATAAPTDFWGDYTLAKN